MTLLHPKSLPHPKAFPIKKPKALCPPSVSLSYPVVNKVEQQILGRGVTLSQEPAIYLSEHEQLRKSSCYAFSSSAAGAVPILACRTLSTAVLRSSSYRLLIIHSPQ
jgi:hypothetical protein